MKTEVKDTVTRIPAFPCLMKSKIGGFILMVNGETEDGCFSGIVLESGTDDRRVIGTYSDTWIKHCFEVFKGSINLSNN